MLAPSRSAPLPAEAACRASWADADVARDRIAVKQAALDQTILKAPFAGTVTMVGAAAGEQVALGARLFVVELATDETDKTDKAKES